MQNSQKDFYKKILGNAGEKLAEKYLKKQGYKILDRNFKTKVGEIDIIAKDGEVLVFTEVKTRSSENYGAPSEAVNKNKVFKYYKVAQEYLIRTKNTQATCRFDVIEVEDGKINHIINAFSV